MISTKKQKKIILGIRILLGGLFLLSGIGKLIDGSDAIYLVELMATKYYWLIEYGQHIVITTSVIELILAGLLFWGRQLNWVLLVSTLLILSFTLVLGNFYIEGMSVESCGCFGAFGLGTGLEVTLIRNAFLLILIGTAFTLNFFYREPEP